VASLSAQILYDFAIDHRWKKSNSLITCWRMMTKRNPQAIGLIEANLVLVCNHTRHYGTNSADIICTVLD